MVVKRNLVLYGVENVSLASGDGTASIEFHPDKAFNNTPAVIVSFMESLGTGKRGFVAATSVTISGFTITVDSDSVLSDIDISWSAFERRSSEEAGL